MSVPGLKPFAEERRAGPLLRRRLVAWVVGSGAADSQHSRMADDRALEFVLEGYRQALQLALIADPDIENIVFAVLIEQQAGEQFWCERFRPKADCLFHISTH